MKHLIKLTSIVSIIAIVGILILGVMTFAQGPVAGNTVGGGNGQQAVQAPRNGPWLGGEANTNANFNANIDTNTNLNANTNTTQSQRPPRGGGLLAEVDGAREIMQAVIANVLGLSVQELEAAQADGLTLRDLAEQQGVSREEIDAARDVAFNQILDQAVVDGTLTQEDADQIRERQNNRPAGPGRRGGGGRNGGRNG